MKTADLMEFFEQPDLRAQIVRGHRGSQSRRSGAQNNEIELRHAVHPDRAPTRRADL